MIRLIIIVFLCCCYLNSITQVIFKNEFYSIKKDKLLDLEKLSKSYYKTLKGSELTYYIEDYYFVISKYTNGTIRNIYGGNNSTPLGINYTLDSLNNLEVVKFEALGREVGPEIVFYSNGLIKSLFNYGFNKLDVDLILKTKLIEIPIEGSDMTLKTDISYYKVKTGTEYHFNEKGTLFKKVLFKNDTVEKIETIKTNWRGH